MVEVEVNGEKRPFDDGTTIVRMLEALKISGGGFAVEINREIVPRGAHSETVLVDGDAVEIVTLVGGG